MRSVSPPGDWGRVSRRRANSLTPGWSLVTWPARGVPLEARSCLKHIAVWGYSYLNGKTSTVSIPITAKGAFCFVFFSLFTCATNLHDLNVVECFFFVFFSGHCHHSCNPSCPSLWQNIFKALGADLQGLWAGFSDRQQLVSKRGQTAMIYSQTHLTGERPPPLPLPLPAKLTHPLCAIPSATAAVHTHTHVHAFLSTHPTPHHTPYKRCSCLSGWASVSAARLVHLKRH